MIESVLSVADSHNRIADKVKDPTEYRNRLVGSLVMSKGVDMDYERTVGRVTQAVRDYRLHDKSRIESALDAGLGLLELKESGGHGEFLPLLERLNLPARTAQDWMQLAAAGVNCATVAHFGGIRKTLERIRQVKRDLRPRLPDSAYTDPDSEFYCPTCVPGATAWQTPDGRCRSHPVTFAEATAEYESTDWIPVIGDALSTVAQAA